MAKKRLCRKGCVDDLGKPLPFKSEGCIHRKTKIVHKPVPASASTDGPTFIPDPAGLGSGGLPRFSSSQIIPSNSANPLPPDASMLLSLDPLANGRPLPMDNNSYEWSDVWDHSTSFTDNLFQWPSDDAGIRDGSMEDPVPFSDFDFFGSSSPFLSSSSDSLPPMTPDSFELAAVDTDGTCFSGLDEGVLDALLSSLNVVQQAHEDYTSLSSSSVSPHDGPIVPPTVACV